MTESAFTSTQHPAPIHHDPTFGFHARTTHGQTALITRRLSPKDYDLNHPVAQRLRHGNGADLIVFTIEHQKQLLKNLGRLPIQFAFTPKNETPPPNHPCTAPLFQLINLGNPGHTASEMPPDYYRQRGITEADIPDHTHMLQDPGLIHMDEHGGYHTSCWARGHAQRALVELRAPGITKLLLNDLRSEKNADELTSFVEDTIQLLPLLGDDACAQSLPRSTQPAATPAKSSDTLKSSAPSAPGIRITAPTASPPSRANSKITPSMTPPCNGFIVSALIDLHATETAPLIENAYAAGNVAIEICGDLEDVQIALGMKDKRATPESVRRNAIRAKHNLPPILLLKNTAETATATNSTPKVGRNDACPCGSGKKHKKRCIDKKR